jgi:cytochrome c
MQVPKSILIALAVTAASPAFAQDAETIQRRGATLVSQHCAMCHAVGRYDESLERQAPPLRTISRRVPLDRLESQLGAGLLGGHPNMPKFAFDARDVDAIMRYLRSIQEH